MRACACLCLCECVRLGMRARAHACACVRVCLDARESVCLRACAPTCRRDCVSACLGARVPARTRRVRVCPSLRVRAWARRSVRAVRCARVWSYVRAVLFVFARVHACAWACVHSYVYGAVEAQKVSGPPLSRYAVAWVRYYPYPRASEVETQEVS